MIELAPLAEPKILTFDEPPTIAVRLDPVDEVEPKMPTFCELLAVTVVMVGVVVPNSDSVTVVA